MNARAEAGPGAVPAVRRSRKAKRRHRRPAGPGLARPEAKGRAFARGFVRRLASGSRKPGRFGRGKLRPSPKGKRKANGDSSNPRNSATGRQWEKAYGKGYLQGYYDGGEGILEARLPADAVFPNVTVESVIAAGIAALRPQGLPLLGPAFVYEELERALTGGIPYSLVRLGDGELLAMAQETVMPAEEVARLGPFLSYAGVNVPDPQARDELAEAVRRASVVGVPLSRKPLFQPLLFKVWQAHGIRPDSVRLTSSTINYSLDEEGYWPKLMSGRRILAVGNAAEPLARALRKQGVQVTAAVGPVGGMNDWERAAREAAGCPFDLALVAAGIAAVPICVRLAETTGKVAVDFGHLADRMAGLREGPEIRR